VKAEYVVVGDEELARSVSRRVATVTTETLKVRTEAGLDASVLGLVPEGDDLTVVDESIDGWVGVSMEEGEGYVSTDYVTLSTEYIYAESKAEEEARLAKEEAARKAAAAAAAAKSSSSSSSASSSSSSATTSYSAPSGSDGQAVVDYACQFVGNPYKYGGSSLTNGTDCSGFVMSVYAAFGVSLPHSSKSMRSVGYGVSVDEMQPGDIICYSGHVAIYVGNNTIVHASTPSTGIKYTSPANYKTILAVRRIF
jgi:cell wall-associated NlpC family hydrolase